MEKAARPHLGEPHAQLREPLALADARYAQATATSTTTIHVSVVMGSNQLAVLKP